MVTRPFISDVLTLKDSISVPDVIALGAAICGLLIVVGSFVLLYKGIITLNEVNRAVRQGRTRRPAAADDNPPVAIDLQIGDQIKIKSQYPALALFVLGISCFFGAIIFDNQKTSDTISLEGHVTDSGKYVFTVTGAMGAIHPDKNGFVRKNVSKDVDELDIEVARPGTTPDSFVVYPSERKHGVLSFGDYPSPTPNTGNSSKPTPTASLPATDPSQVAPTPSAYSTPS